MGENGGRGIANDADRFLMLVFFCGKLRIELHFLFVAVLLFACLYDPTGIALMGLGASMLHELAHFFFLWMFRCRPNKLSFELAGVTVVKSGYQLTRCKELLVLLAGSGFNLLAAWCCFSWAPVGAAVHLLVGVFNLLPFPALDGGKMVSLLLERVLVPEKAAWVELMIQIVILLLITTICIISIRAGTVNWMLLITVCYLFSLVLFSE